MRKFSSYGSVNTKLNYYALRKELSERAYTQLIGEDPDEGGHYITAWGPRQTGKTWLMQQVLFRLQEDERFDVVPIVLQTIPEERDISGVIKYISADIAKVLNKRLNQPFEDLSDVITAESLNIKNLLLRYQDYLLKNRGWLLKNAPRRSDLRIYEAVYHFNLYMYLQTFLRNRKGVVYPEFTTGNGQIDLIIKYQGRIYGIEVKSYTDKPGYDEALDQAARYAESLGLTEITLAFFIEAVDDDNRSKYEATYTDAKRGVTVRPVFVEIGNRNIE